MEFKASLVAQRVKCQPTTWETQVQSLGWEYPWRRKWQPTLVLLPGKFHGQRSLVGYRPQGCKESDMTEQLHFTSLSFKRQASFNFMAAVTICSDFGAQENKLCHCFHCFPTDMPCSDGTGCHDLSFLNVEFEASFSLSSFTFIKRLFNFSSLPAKRVVSSAYLRLLLFLLAILIPACAPSAQLFS